MVRSDPVITVVISVISIILGLPVAVATLLFNQNWVPKVILGSKTINTGLGKTTTIDFGILTGPNDAILVAALISIASTALIIIGLVLTRHFTEHNAFGWLAFGPALLNILSQVGCCVAVFIFNNRNPAATSRDQIRYANGKYSTGGTLYTKEAWSCSMNALYPEKEGHWANQACSRFGTARTLTVPMAVCAACLFSLACWQVVERGGFGWLFGRKDKVAAVYKAKGEYFDLQS
ncbi:hypothetical protein HBH56_121880 [Parastagonospora nodorum]|uniref:Uncharacterized protein n=2 Tax=Phaeosphaeria nodorum (strain SN15 / ATCC MYA-4574 / FGSC 10173) TaxID=321614 RepID=A0A7U2EQ71_PHANO|nr:hypothetical protein SNOG_00520 [Parastagonospora nodorum SN15]KAH3912118.1 hypothetical protein HBH56_121880 [Parastagonospora nodorum]EAT92015.1 hypothetical protein SNOG_00520 [Parastagonospora nodorum SN15]KAH3934702.1 hypothetical protein HBH54_047430 [Parastagonospora nodorum]KAH3986796.1 hypothetical protein HBH51_009620 [Parastagonospora nodorum]KAH3987552.1 hypothetical protein HBH52_037800 [Parastagonospora nodorum]